ncbi:MAG: hypothetical protein AB1478_12375 [Nitrospirota bacterium]
MKLLSIKQARSIWLIYLIELNPRGLNLYTLIKPIIEKYKFQIYPRPEELGFGKEIREIKFGGGNFQKDPKHNIAFDLTIHNDGLIVDTRSSTQDSDNILKEFLTWISAEIDLVPYNEVLRSQLYLSELYVHTEKSLNSLNPKLADFATRLNSLMIGQHDQPIALETSSISFWNDSTKGSPVGSFRFERVIDVPFSTNRYYSVASLQTDAHLKMLDELEDILSS